jgi:hypothetical protein
LGESPQQGWLTRLFQVFKIAEVSHPCWGDSPFGTTLEEVLDYYNDPKKFVADPVNIDELLKEPLGLTDMEKKDIIAFLKTLTDKKYLRRQ